MQVIDTPDGPIPIPLAIPQPGAPLHIPRLGDLYTWDDVDRWAGQALSTAHDLITAGVDLFSSAADLTVNNVRAMVRSALDIQTETFSGFINLTFTYAETAFDIATQSIADLEEFAISNVSDLWGRILALSEFAYGLALDTVRGIDNLRMEIDRLINDVGTWTIDQIETWALDNIYHPLLRDITDEKVWVRARIDSGLGHVQDQIDTIRHADIPDVLTKLGVIAGVAAAVTTWVDECGAPMCESFGPGTDLKKALDALKGLLGLLAGVAVADLTEAQLESMAGLFAKLSSTAADDFFDAFVAGGETLGSAGGEILGDLGGIGVDVLRELGVPV